jgi:DNA end-binding protein Ku
VRSSKDAFSDIKKGKIEPEMLKLAQHILKTKAGTFEPEKFDDRYEAALAELVKAKIEGRKIVPLRRPEPTKSNDLLEALRLSAGGQDNNAPAPKKRRTKKPAEDASKTTAPRRKAG